MKPILIPLSESETASLIRESVSKILPLAFGSRGVALKADEAPWALPLLAQWRGITFTDGGGI